MKKIKNIMIVAILLVASAVNFGILTNQIGLNLSYACNSGCHAVSACGHVECWGTSCSSFPAAVNCNGNLSVCYSDSDN